MKKKKKKKALPGCLSNTQASNKRVLYETDHNIRYKQHKIKKVEEAFDEAHSYPFGFSSILACMWLFCYL